MKTTWKDIQPVPTSQEFLDIVLSRTQRRLPTQIRAGFQISRIRSMRQNSLRDCRILTFTRFLHTKGQIHTRDLHGEVVSDFGRFPTIARHSSFPQGSPEHSLRCRSFQDSPRPVVDCEASHRNCLSRLCSTAQICTIIIPMQAAQARSIGSNGNDLPKTERSSSIPRSSTTAPGSSSFDRSQY
jgi:NOG1 N-terminal helical domain